MNWRPCRTVSKRSWGVGEGSRSESPPWPQSAEEACLLKQDGQRLASRARCGAGAVYTTRLGSDRQLGKSNCATAGCQGRLATELG